MRLKLKQNDEYIIIYVRPKGILRLWERKLLSRYHFTEVLTSGFMQRAYFTNDDVNAYVKSIELNRVISITELNNLTW